MNDLIRCVNAVKVLTDDGNMTLDKHLQTLKPNEEFYLQVVKKADVRSVQQNKLYWSLILPALQYYVDWLDFCPDPTQDKQTAHFMTKMTYCLTVRDDLLIKVKMRNPVTGDKKIVTRYLPFSWAIHEMPTKEANQFITWCKDQIEKHSGVDFDTAIRSM